MIDLSLVRTRAPQVRDNVARRHNPLQMSALSELEQIDKDWRQQKQALDGLRQQRNSISLRISEAKKAGNDVAAILEDAKKLPAQVAEAEACVAELEKRLALSLRKLPNLLQDSVPEGPDATHNVVVKIFGKPKTSKFPLKSHVDIATEKGWVDMERASKIAGSRWYFLKEELAVLEMALVRYGIDFMRKKGFSFVVPPHMMNRTAYEGVTDLGAFEDVLYKAEGEDLFCIATSEHPLTAQYMNELLSSESLPLKHVGYSTNFRKEAGAHGKDQKGIFRVHQFNKIEQIIICKPEESEHCHEEMVRNAVEFWKSMGVPFRQVLLCAGDTGTVASKCYDMEAWFPVQNEYREVGSLSNCTEYQSRALNIKHLKGDERVLCHTLNGTLVATSRALVCFLENFQQKDGSVKVPKPLWKYAGFKVMGTKHGKV